MPFVLPLEQAQKHEHRWRCGNKAAILSQLRSDGFPVPDGFVITADAFDQAVKAAGTYDRLMTLLDELDRADTGEIVKLAWQLQDLVDRTPLPEDLVQAVADAHRLLGDKEVAVRSSSNLEDRQDHSFAGQHDSFLNVGGLEACLTSIRRVWRSLFNTHALTLLKALRISPRQSRMSVLVQVMVPARWAGVGYTVSPYDGDNSRLMIHAVAGLGEAYVNGSRSPQELWVTRATNEVTRMGGSASEETQLSDTRGVAVASLMKAVETALAQGPLDIEWASDNHELYLLQARPLTGSSRPETLCWESPIPGAHWRRRWRLGEWLRDPVTPLFASWVIPRLTSARERFGGNRLGWHHPRSFAMPVPWYCLVHGYFYARQDLPDNVGAGMPFPQRLQRMKELRIFLEHWTEQELPALVTQMHQRRKLCFDSMPATQLVEWLDLLVEEAGELWYVIAPLGYGFEKLVFAPLYERILSGETAPHFSLLFRGFPNPAVDAQQRLWQIAQRIRTDETLKAILTETRNLTPDQLPQWLKQELNAYHYDFGHLVKSLDFYFATTAETPGDTLAALAMLVSQQVEEPGQILERNRQTREQAYKKVVTLLRAQGTEGKDLIELIDCFQKNAAVREQALSAFQLAWPLLRRTVLALGNHLVQRGVLGDASQIFFLERDEVLGILAGNPCPEGTICLAELAEGRYRTWNQRRSLGPPETLPVDTENPQVTGYCGYQQDEEGPRLIGQGVSAGVYRGKVRLVEEMTTTICKGDVLVTAMASPALTPLMLLAGALVVDVGGGASHSSLVARELGLPTVVNAIEATRRLHDGQIVEVNGITGTVRIL